MDYRRVVRDGYDRIAERYAYLVGGAGRTRGIAEQQERYIRWVLDALPAGSHVLDLGCGAGIPVAASLSARFRVTGVDFSAVQLRLAHSNVPAAQLILGDMTTIEFRAASFDAVVAFWSIIHVPRSGQQAVVHSIARWLRPGGLFVASMGVKSREVDVENDWLGVPMFWSHYDPARNRAMCETAGFTVESDVIETVEDGVDGPETFQWLIARRAGV